MERDELLPGRLRAAGAIGAAGAAVAALGLALYTAGRRRTPVDGLVDDWLRAPAQRWDTVFEAVVVAARPLVVLGGCLAAAILLALRGGGRAAALCAAGPAAGMALTVAVQNLADRPSATVAGSHDAYPSGHMVGPAAVVIVLLIIRAAGGAGALTRQVAGVLALAAAAGGCLLAVSIVAMRHHYITDVLGAVAVAVATVLGCALVLDANGTRVSRTAGRYSRTGAT